MEISRNKDIDALFDAILALKTREECYSFFTDALTVREVQDIAQRLKAAKMLRRGSSYIEVCKETGMSTATISRVSKALEKGEGGYELVIKRTEKTK